MEDSPKRATLLTRWLLAYSGVLALTAAVLLSLFAERTDRYFSWTIASPLTAASFGGAYFAACALELLSARERRWSRARIGAPVVALFSILMLIVTVVHLDRFHFESPLLFARIGAWFWIYVYVTIPATLLPAAVAQQLLGGGVEPRVAPLPGWLRALLCALAVLCLALGVGLLLAPELAGRLWPWALTPLTGRATGAWLVGWGFLAAHAAYEDDVFRARAAMIVFVLLAALEGLALARFGGEVDWGAPAVWFYLAGLWAFAAAGAAGWRAAAVSPVAIERPMVS